MGTAASGSICFSLVLSFSPKAEPKLEKKSGCQPRSHGDSGPQKELMIPGIVDFELIREAVRTSKPQTPSAYRFGRLSHHSFFSRHHPQPQHVTHIQGRAGVGQGLMVGVGVLLLEREDPATLGQAKTYLGQGGDCKGRPQSPAGFTSLPIPPTYKSEKGMNILLQSCALFSDSGHFIHSAICSSKI